MRTPSVGANEWQAKEGADPLPERLAPHSLRGTYASLLYALGESPAYVMAHMGHTSPNLALAIYARAMDRCDGRARAAEGDAASSPIAVPVSIGTLN
jgi:integrase